MCRSFLEFKWQDESRFERAIRILLQPIIEPRHDNQGKPIPGTEYLVNAASMLGALELVAGYGYGKPRQQVDIPGAGITLNFLIEPARPQTREAWLAAHAESQRAIVEADTGQSEPGGDDEPRELP